MSVICKWDGSHTTFNCFKERWAELAAKGLSHMHDLGVWYVYKTPTNIPAHVISTKAGTEDHLTKEHYKEGHVWVKLKVALTGIKVVARIRDTFSMSFIEGLLNT